MDAVLPAHSEKRHQAKAVAWVVSSLYLLISLFVGYSLLSHPGDDPKSVVYPIAALAMMSFFLPQFMLLYGARYGANHVTATKGTGSLAVFVGSFLFTLLMLLAVSESFMAVMTSRIDEITGPIFSVPGIGFPEYTPLVSVEMSIAALLFGSLSLLLCLKTIRSANFGMFSVSAVCAFLFLNILIVSILSLVFGYIFPQEVVSINNSSSLSAPAFIMDSVWVGMGFSTIQNAISLNVLDPKLLFVVAGLVVYGLIMVIFIKVYPHYLKLADCLVAFAVFVTLMIALTIPKNMLIEKITKSAEAKALYFSQDIKENCAPSPTAPYCWTVAVLQKNNIPLTESNVELLSGLNGQQLASKRVLASLVVSMDDLMAQKPMPALAEWMARSYRNSLNHTPVGEGEPLDTYAETLDKIGTLQALKLAIDSPSKFVAARAQVEDEGHGYLHAIKVAIEGSWDVSVFNKESEDKRFLKSKNGVLSFHFKKGSTHSVSMHDDGRYSIESIEAIVKVADEDLPAFKSE